MYVYHYIMSINAKARTNCETILTTKNFQIYDVKASVLHLYIDMYRCSYVY